MSSGGVFLKAEWRSLAMLNYEVEPDRLTKFVPAGTELELGRTAIRVSDAEDVRVPLHERESLGGIVGRSSAMRRLMDQIERAAKSDVSVLVDPQTRQVTNRS